VLVQILATILDAAQAVSPAPAAPAPVAPPAAFGGSPALWIAFGALVLGVIYVDLFVLHRKERHVSLREAAVTGSAFVMLALTFGAVVAWKLGRTSALDFLTGYVVELSLSFDNLFVFLVLFRFFGVEKRHQHRVLFWGILGALVLRAVFIAVGSALLNRFEWLLYLFGIFLVFTGVKLLSDKHVQIDPERNLVLRLARRLLPVTSTPPEGRFFLIENGRRCATTLFLCLLCVEASDVVFAVDSIPAIFGITRDPFVVYTSNVFAVLGLRSFYALLAILMAAFRYLNVGLAVVLIFIGAKMLSAELLEERFGFHVGPGLSLGIVFLTLATAIAASLLRRAPPSDPERGVDAPR